MRNQNGEKKGLLKMKKIWICLFALVLVSGMAGCSSSAKQQTGQPSSAVSEVSETEDDMDTASPSSSAAEPESDLEEDSEPADSSDEEPTEQPDEESTEEPDDSEESDAEELVDGMRPAFKETLDSYEAFFDEYCEFMKKYMADPSDLSLLQDYSSFMQQYEETMSKMDALDDGQMNDAETQYYIEVTTRISQKLLEVSTTTG